MSVYIPDLQTSIPIELSSNVSQVISLNMSPGQVFGGVIRFLVEVNDPLSADVIQSAGGAATFIVATPENLSPMTMINQTMSGSLINTGTLATAWSINSSNPSLVSIIITITSTGITNPTYRISVSPLNVGVPTFNLGVPPP
jgi:hypothetical protein